MRMLIEKLAERSLITSELQNVSYPASNMKHPYARVYYKANSFEDAIRFFFDYEYVVDCIFYTYSNAKSMVLKLYNSESTLLKTVNVDCKYETNATYFERTEGVRFIDVEAATDVSNDLRIGKIEFGESIIFPLPSASFVPMLDPLSSSSVSDHGQVSYQYIEPRMKYALKHQGVIKEQYLNEVLEIFRKVDRGHLWIDVTEDDHRVYRPLYCVSNLIENGERNGDRVVFSLTFTEAR